MKDAAAAHATALVRAARDGSDAPLAHARAALEGAGFRLDVRDGGLVARRGAPRLALSGHVDVVPPGEGWTREPFSGAVEDGRVHGRGASDMLGAVGAFLAVAGSTRAPLAVLLTTDEETTMAAAEAMVRDRRLEGLEAVVVGEPTDLEPGTAEKGVLWATVTVRGRAAHASMPDEGENAVLLALAAVAKVAGLRASGSHPLLGRPTIAVTGIRGGVARNVVPDACAFDLDVRFLPGRRVEDAVALLRMALVDAGVRFDLAVHSAHPPFEAKPEARLAREALALLPGRAAVGLPYGTEASRFQAVGLDLLVFGPGERALAHTNRESVAVEALGEAGRVYAALAERYS